MNEPKGIGSVDLEVVLNMIGIAVNGLKDTCSGSCHGANISINDDIEKGTRSVFIKVTANLTEEFKKMRREVVNFKGK